MHCKSKCTFDKYFHYNNSLYVDLLKLIFLFSLKSPIMGQKMPFYRIASIKILIKCLHIMHIYICLFSCFSGFLGISTMSPYGSSNHTFFLLLPFINSFIPFWIPHLTCVSCPQSNLAFKNIPHLNSKRKGPFNQVCFTYECRELLILLPIKLLMEGKAVA